MCSAIELSRTHRIEQGSALDQFIAAQREQSSLGHPAHRVVCATDALQEGRDRARCGQLADQFHITDIDAQFQRGGGDQCPQLAGLEALFGIETLLRERLP